MELVVADYHLKVLKQRNNVIFDAKKGEKGVKLCKMTMLTIYVSKIERERDDLKAITIRNDPFQFT